MRAGTWILGLLWVAAATAVASPVLADEAAGGSALPAAAAPPAPPPPPADGPAVAAPAVAVPPAVAGPAVPAPETVVAPVISDEQIKERVEAWHKSQKSDVRVYWKNGLRFESRDGKYKSWWGGRLMLDATSFGDAEDLETAIDQEFHSGFQFRRAWLEGSGTFHDHVSYMFQYGYEGGDVIFLDVWAALTDLYKCWGCAFPDIQVGSYQEPFGLAWLTPSKWFTMMAWPSPTIAFTPGYNTGVTLSRQFWGERVTARLGLFGADSNPVGDFWWRDGYAVTGRLTFLPWAPCDCDSRVFHLGVSASYRGDVETARFRTRADVDLGPYVVDTAAFAALEAYLLDLEAAWVYDRFKIQAEVMGSYVDAVAGTDPLLWGAYVESSFLVGAPSHTFVKKSASFGQVKVCNPLLGAECRGLGALEFAVRFSYVDLDDGDKQGGKVWDAVLGANWYLVDNARFMLNLVYADVENAYGSRVTPASDGDRLSLAARFQVHF